MSNSLSISAELTYVRFKGLMNTFMSASKRYGIPLALLLAVASRESRMGMMLDSEGKGDNGYAWGIMQIDKRYHPSFTDNNSPFDHEANIYYSAEFLASLWRQFEGNPEYVVASYNAGAGKIRRAISAGIPVDHATYGGDYASDVLGRMQQIKTLLPASQPISLVVLSVPVGLISLGIYKHLTN